MQSNEVSCKVKRVISTATLTPSSTVTPSLTYGARRGPPPLDFLKIIVKGGNEVKKEKANLID